MHKCIGKLIVLVGWSLFVYGCTTVDTTPVERKVFIATEQETPQASRALSEGDAIELSVEVDGNMEVTFYRAAVSQQGNVTLPLVGDLKLSGLKLEEAREIIALAYSKYYVNLPVIMISLVNTTQATEWGFVTVLGRVEQPGRIPLSSSKGINLSAAIQQSGGFAASAKTTEIRITRTDELGMKIRTTIDFDKIGSEGDASSDLKLINGDIVFVPERIF